MADIQRVTTRCWGVTGYGYQCMEHSTHLIASTDSNHHWSCKQHLAQVVEAVHVTSGAATVRVTAIAWHEKGHGHG